MYILSFTLSRKNTGVTAKLYRMYLHHGNFQRLLCLVSLAIDGSGGGGGGLKGHTPLVYVLFVFENGGGGACHHRSQSCTCRWTLPLPWCKCQKKKKKKLKPITITVWGCWIFGGQGGSLPAKQDKICSIYRICHSLCMFVFVRMALYFVWMRFWPFFMLVVGYFLYDILLVVITSILYKYTKLWERIVEIIYLRRTGIFLK